MQMLSPVEQLEALLISEVGKMVRAGHDVLSIRSVVTNNLMPNFPQYYSWSNRVGDNGFQVEIFDRSDAGTALIKIELELR